MISCGESIGLYSEGDDDLEEHVEYGDKAGDEHLEEKLRSRGSS